jgi:hypothetical protein
MKLNFIKKASIFGLLLLATISFVSFDNVSQVNNETSKSEKFFQTSPGVGIFRLYGPGIRRHHYTTYPYGEIVRTYSVNEGGLCVLQANPTEGHNAVHLLVNPVNGNQIMTTNEAEKNTIISQHGFAYVGIMGYAPSSYEVANKDRNLAETRRGKDIHRFYNRKRNIHFYTNNPYENVSQFGYSYEGVAFIGY